MRPTRHLWIAGSIVALAAFPAWGQVKTLSELRVNTRTDFKQLNPAAAFVANGHAVVVWENDQAGVRGQLVDAAGTPIGAEKTLVASEPIVGSDLQTIATRREPVVASLPKGGFVVAYTEEIDEVRSFAFIETRTVVDQDVYLQRFDAAGKPVGARALVNTTTAGFQHQPRLIARGRGNLLVAWESADGGIYVRSVSAFGSVLGGEIRINDEAGSHLAGAASASTNLVVWEADDGSGVGVFGRLLKSSGEPLGPVFRVSSTTAGRQRRPAVAAGAGGSYLVAWQGDLEITTHSRIYAQAVGAGGNLMGPQLTLVEGVGYDVAQIAPALAATPSGHFLLTWLGWRSATSIGFEMAAAEIDGLGNTIGKARWVAQDRVLRNFRRTSIASNGRGLYLTPWEMMAQGRQSIAARLLGTR
jgi:hypothetical protein